MIQAMKKPSRREVAPGIVVARGKNGSVGIYDNGYLAGWLHACFGTDWRVVINPGLELQGKFKELPAIRATVRAFRARQEEEAKEYASA